MNNMSDLLSFFNAPRWASICDKLVFQSYYRILSFVSLHAPIDEVYEAVTWLSKYRRGGEVYWVKLLEGRVARWDNIELAPDVYMNLWIFGSPIRRKNTIYARVGWWNLYLLTAYGLSQQECLMCQENQRSSISVKI